MNDSLSIDDAADLSEPLIGAGVKELLQIFVGTTLPEIVGEFSYAKILLSIGRIYNISRDAHRARNLLSFLSGLQQGKKTMEQFNALSEDEKDYIRGVVISQLDME